MTNIDFHRPSTVPSTFDGNALYFIPEGNGHFSIYTKDTNSGVVRRIPTIADIEAKITASLASLSSVEVVADITARDALALAANTLVVVTDASADASVNSGAAFYVGEPGSPATWTKLAEFESMDITLSWANITGKPSSSVADIDDAVTKRHAHQNLTQLGKIDQDAGGNLTYDGALPHIGWDSAAW